MAAEKQADALNVTDSLPPLVLGTKRCPKCNFHALYDDDSHGECMRCRGLRHSCPICSEMGEKSLERVKEWKAKHLDNPSSVSSVGVKSGASHVPTNLPQERPVSFSDLKEFGESIKSFVADILKEHTRPNSQGNENVQKSIPPSGDGMGSTLRVNLGASTSGVRPSVPEVSLHPDSHSDGELSDEGDNEDDARSTRSSWDYKRIEDHEVEEDTLSVGLSDREEEESLNPSQSEQYVEHIRELIKTLSIGDAVQTSKSKSKITSSRCREEKAKALLPFDENHRNIVDEVWRKDASVISAYRKNAKDRYKLVDADFNKYLQVSKVKDEYLVQELEKAGVKVQVKNPKIPNKELALIESRVAKIESQSLLGIACAVSQSWMLQYVTFQVNKLNKLLKEGMQPENYKTLNDQVDLKKLEDMSILAQDAALDSLDLQARQAAGSKWVKRSLWLDQTRWAPSIKDALKHFPTVGDGTICGPNLKDKLESYRLTSKALEASHFGGPAQRGRGQGKRGRQGGSRKPSPPPAKRFKFDGNFQNNSRGRGRGSAGRGQSKSQTTPFAKSSSHSLSG